MAAFWFVNFIAFSLAGFSLTSEPRYPCTIWGDPHVTRFPSNANEQPQEFWCQDSGLQSIVRNKYVTASMVVSGYPYIVLDFNFVFLNDDGIPICTFNANQFSSATASCGSDVTINTGPDSISITYDKIDFSVFIRKTYWGSAYSNIYYSIFVYQSLCLIKMSDGLCKRGCAPITGRRRRAVTQINSSDMNTTLVSAKAKEICQVYIDSFVRVAPKNLTAREISNIQSACITDVSNTGDTQFARTGAMVLAIQSVFGSNTNFQTFTDTIANKLTGVLTLVNETNQQADNQVSQIIKQISNYNAFLQTAVYMTSDFCRSYQGVSLNDSFLVAYAHSNYAGGCGPTYGRSLFTFREIDEIPLNRINNFTAILKLFGGSLNETNAPFQAYGGIGITNEAVIRRVISPWSPVNVTWFNQPTTTSRNEVVIPATTLEELYNVTLNVTKLVYDMRLAGPQLTVRAESKRCYGLSQYDQCSTNIACGCFNSTSATDSDLCGFRWLTYSELNSCMPNTYMCLEPNHVCVHHPDCQDLPLCYPLSMTSHELCPTISSTTTTTTTYSPPPESDNKLCLTATWATNGITVAGGKGFGHELDQLADPYGIFLDANDTIYVADRSNHRIVTWKQGDLVGQLAAGVKWDMNRKMLLNMSQDLVVDHNGTMYIADGGNKRLLQWPRGAQDGETIADDIQVVGIGQDDEGSIYVSEYANGKLTKWRRGETSGHVIPTRLHHSNFLFVDQNRSIYVVSYMNHRVVKITEGVEEAVVVAGCDHIKNIKKSAKDSRLMQQELSRSAELTSNRPISSSSANSQLDKVDDASPTSMPTSHTESQIVVNQSMQASKRLLASQSQNNHPAKRSRV
ncbi:unnamed protein product [Rotaria socialis]